MNDEGVDPRRLRMLVELSRRGTMRAVAGATGYATSTVSQQLAVLEREAGAALLEPVGRTVRLTAAGRRLAQHAEGILAALEVARADLDEGADPAGVVRVASFATALSTALLPVTRELAGTHPRLRLELQEREPDEVFRLLRDDEIDLGVTYDYSLAPRPPVPGVTARLLWRTAWHLGVPTGLPIPRDADRTTLMTAVGETPWIVNSRGPDDENVVGTLGALAGVRPHIGHRADSLDLVREMIAAGLGVGMLPRSTRRHPGVKLLALKDPPVQLRTYAVVRSGRERWAPLALIIDLLARRGRPSPPGSGFAGRTRVPGGERTSEHADTTGEV